MSVMRPRRTTMSMQRCPIGKVMLCLALVCLLSVQAAVGLKSRHNKITEFNEEIDYPSVEESQAGGLLKTIPNPIVFIPGNGGSQLEARLNKTSRVHYICSLQSDWFDIWLNIHLLTPLSFDCLTDNLKLTYNRTSGITSNSPGVEVRPKNFGSLDSVDFLDNLRLPKTDYFHKIIRSLEEKFDMVPNLHMLGAPFDFRKAPNELAEFFTDLTALIEQQYVALYYKPITLICHSMGCLNAQHFLNKKTSAWKKVFIKRLIALAAPWSGSFKAISAILNGDNFGMPLLNANKLELLQKTFPSLVYLFPRPPAFPIDGVLVETASKNFSLENLDDFLLEAQLVDQRNMWHQTRIIAAALSAPNVELWCLYGSGVDTPSRIVYRDSLEANNYEVIQGDGDGSVNLESLRVCQQFSGQQEEPVYTKMFPLVSHTEILRAPEAADYITSQILIRDSNV